MLFLLYHPTSSTPTKKGGGVKKEKEGRERKGNRKKGKKEENKNQFCVKKTILCV